MTWKKTLIRHLLFAVLAAAPGLFCTGCFTAETWHHLGKTEVILPEESLRYQVSPDGSEIVFSGKQKTAHYCWPLIHCVDSNRGHSKYTWNTYTPLEKRVSLDSFMDPHWRQVPVPYREKLVRFHLIVEPDPSVPRAWLADDSTPCFETPAERMDEVNIPPENNPDYHWIRHYVNPDETVRLRVNPDDLPLLSDRQYLFLRFSKRQTEEAPGSNGPLLVCPAGQDGSRYDMLAYSGHDHFDRSFWDGILEHGSTGTAGYCWKILWMPAAVVADVIALPVYLICPGILMREP